MPVNKIDIPQFLSLAAAHPVLDVRSEGEYIHAHFPGAVSLPLFSNEERKVVGTAYKQQSQQKAIKVGLQYFGKKMVDLVEQVEALFKKENLSDKSVVVYCWRGGMRSGGVAWLLDLYGFKVYQLVGGYKAFRRWGLQQLEADHPVKLVGGYSGSGKTEVLHALKQQGQTVIDLEGLANHKGSAFGSIGMPPQPSQEMFENMLALQLWRSRSPTAMGNMENQPSTTCIWMEDESQRIGSVNIPTSFFKKLLEKPVFFLDIPFEARLHHIAAGYGRGDKERLVNAIIRIQKRLGGLNTKLAINHLLEGKTEESFRILLEYYDRLYHKGLTEKPASLVHRLPASGVNATENATLILQHSAPIQHA